MPEANKETVIIESTPRHNPQMFSQLKETTNFSNLDSALNWIILNIEILKTTHRILQIRRIRDNNVWDENYILEHTKIK